MPGEIKPGSVLAAAAAVVVALLVLWLWPSGAARPESKLPRASTTLPRDQPYITQPEVVVHLSGAVANPGVYRLEPGLRLVDLVEAAGGAADTADLDRLNLAQVLHDGDRVHVPLIGEAPGAAPDLARPQAEGGVPVDINTATAAELEALPGIGPALAAAIVDERQTGGPFGSVDDLDRVSGIGPAKIDGLRDHARV